MTDQLRKAALDFLRLAIEAPKGHGFYAIDKNGAVYWFKERPDTSPGEDYWKTKYGAGIPNEMQKILCWDSLLFSAEELASTPVEPPQSGPAPTPKMGPFDMERFKAGEVAYGESISGNMLNYRYLGELFDSGDIACAVSTPCDLKNEMLFRQAISQLEQHTKMPVKTKKVYIELWLDNSGHFFTS